MPIIQSNKIILHTDLHKSIVEFPNSLNLHLFLLILRDSELFHMFQAIQAEVAAKLLKST